MVAKNQRKKQVVASFHQKSRETVSIEVHHFQLSNIASNVHSIPYLSSFMSSLSSATNVDEQIKIVQSQKGTIRANILNDSTAIGEIATNIEILLQLFVLPAYLPIRSSLEWTAETLSQIKSISVAQKSVIIHGTCMAIWNKCISSGIYNHIDSQSNTTDMLSWCFTLNYLCVLEKEYGWLGVNTVDLVDPTDALLFRFTEFISSVFTACADIVVPPAHNAEVTSPVIGSSSEVVRFAECCGETMRAVATMLKVHKAAYIPTRAYGKWTSTIDSVFDSTCRLLRSDLVSKDVVTSTAMGVVSLLWLTRRSSSRSGTEDGKQLAVMIALMNLRESAEYRLTEIQSIARETGLHESFTQCLSSLPIISKCAIIKACLSIFDDASLLYAYCKDGSELSTFVDMSAGCDVDVSKANAMLFDGPVFACIMLVANHSMSLNRLYGFQTLEAWLNRYEVMLKEGVVSVSAADSSTDNLFSKLLAVAKMLTDAWSHPSRQLSHIVPTIYSRLVNFISVAFPCGTQTERVSLWDPLLQQSLAMPAQHRGKYQTMNILLPYVGASLFFAVQGDIIRGLCEAVRERDISSSTSSFVGSLLSAYHHEQCTAAGGDKSNSLVVLKKMRPLWDSYVVEAVCSLNSKMRVNSADYLIPEMLRLDATAGSHLIKLIHNTVQRSGDELNSKLWGLVNVCLQCRLLGLTTGNSILFNGNTSTATDQDGQLTEEELTMACLSDDDELRLVSLTTIVASLKTAAPVNADELRVLKYALVYSLKSPESDHRHKVTRVVKTLLTRVKESSRVHEKELKKAERALLTLSKDKITAAQTMVVDTSESTESTVAIDTKESIDYDMRIAEAQKQIIVSREVVDTANSVCLWLRDLLIDNLYPGTSSDREVMSLDLIKCMFDTMGVDSPCMQCFNNDRMVHTLLNLFMSSWDRSRKMAADLLLKFPHPLPGYNSANEAAELLAWGCQLAGSPRLRESDAGALLVRNVYTIYCLDLGWELRIPSTFNAAAVQPRNNDDNIVTAFLSKQSLKSTRCALFVSSMCDELADRLAVLDSVFSTLNINEMCQLAEASSIAERDSSKMAVELPTASDVADTIPLCHGLILALKFCLLESHAANLFAFTTDTQEDLELSYGTTNNYWQHLIRRVYRQYLLSLKIAMTVVAEAPSDVPFAPVPFGSAAVPAVAAENTMAASYINTNSIMGAGTGEETTDEKGSAVQRAVVAAWLLVKEATALLATLVDISPPIADVSTDSSDPTESVSIMTEDNNKESRKRPRKDTKDTDVLSTKQQLHSSSHTSKVALPLLTVEDISHAGSTILDALGRLKHMGAIAEAHAALQSISATVLRHGERSTTLCRLPAMWLKTVLTRLEGEQQVFILRRSAGFAYSFHSLLRAEPSNCKPTLLPQAMTSLLRTIEVGMLETLTVHGGGIPMTTDGSNQEESSRWKLSVHALNVVRLILVDAAVGPDVDYFVAKCTELAVRGFSSTRWAVRNSSMMVFSAVVQRAIDNDKNDSGGASAATAAEFFQRFPTLFPFLLGELAAVTNFELIAGEDGWPVRIQKRETSVAASHSTDDVHPSLYPLLLLLSKLRAAMVSAVPTAAELSVKDTVALKEGRGQPSMAQIADISLFVPMVESCSPQKVHQVRSMAAKALAALIPLREVPAKAAQLLTNLIATVGSVVSSNNVHGSLQLVQEIFQGLHRHVCGSTISNRPFFATLQAELHDICAPLLGNIVTLLEHGSSSSVANLALLRILRIARDIVHSSSSAYQTAFSTLLAQHCVNIFSGKISADSVSFPVRPLPYEPVLWREALVLWVQCSPSVSRSLTISNASILALLNCPVSEVREGVLLGCVALSESEAVTNSNQFLSSPEFLEALMNRAALEKEPPILQLTMELLCSVTRKTPLSAYPTATRKKLVSVSGISVFGSLVSKQWSSQDSSSAIELRLTTSACSACEVLGWLVGELLVTNQQTASCHFIDVFRQWVRVLEAASSEDQICSMREAAAASIRVSNFLPYINKIVLANANTQTMPRNVNDIDALIALSLRVWLVLLTLLQDDDFDVREAANIVGCTAADSLKTIRGDAALLPTGFLCNESYTLDHMSDNLAALLTSVASTRSQESVYVCLGLLTGTLLSHISNAQAAVLSLTKADNSAVSQKIFEAEQANLFVEPVKGAIVLSRAICNALKTNAATRAVAPIVVEVARNAVQTLEICGGNRWSFVMGGVTEQRDVFQQLYLSFDLLARYLDGVVEHGLVVDDVVKDVCREVRKVSSTNSVVCHPWIEAALTKIVASWDR